MSLTPRIYSSRAAVFVNGYNEGMTEFVGENINPGKNIVELSFTVVAYHYHMQLRLSQAQST